MASQVDRPMSCPTKGNQANARWRIVFEMKRRQKSETEDQKKEEWLDGNEEAISMSVAADSIKLSRTMDEQSIC